METTTSTSFPSILFRHPDDVAKQRRREPPAFFTDVNLDQIISAITAGKEDYDLTPFFFTPLRDADAIGYRHEVMRDLENPGLFEKLAAFARQMRAMREHVARADKLHYTHQKESWFLDAVEIYCDAVTRLLEALTSAGVKSRGLLAFREYLTGYAESDRFTSLQAETTQLKRDLSTVRYCVLVKDAGFTVRRYESEVDYSVDVEETFAKFKQGAVKDYRVQFSTALEMNHIEAKVLEFVALLNPEVFSGLDTYCERHRGYVDEAIRVFDRELHFYIAYLEWVAIFRRAGLKVCYPRVSSTSKETYDYEGFDAALAYQLVRRDSPVVVNDFSLTGAERIIVVSGPNQGGKTTFARTFGQLHYLASLGCPVPGREAQLLLFDAIFTHFERGESLKDLRGKLEDDLVRIRGILDAATSSSVVIINEIFASTTLKDAIVLSTRVMERLMALDVLGVCVTFVDELASLSEKTVSMVSTVVPDNPAQRTYKIVRRPADGLAYALSIAAKYRVTYECLKERLEA